MNGGVDDLAVVCRSLLLLCPTGSLSDVCKRLLQFGLLNFTSTVAQFLTWVDHLFFAVCRFRGVKGDSLHYDKYRDVRYVSVYLRTEPVTAGIWHTLTNFIQQEQFIFRIARRSVASYCRRHDADITGRAGAMRLNTSPIHWGGTITISRKKRMRRRVEHRVAFRQK